eukprot:2238699-Pleurochrysis_carterae.AAC.1
MERKAHGVVDFGTHLRSAAVNAKMRRHTEAMRCCRLALGVLKQWADVEEAASPQVQRAFDAHTAVVYHNIAVQLAHDSQLQGASATAALAEKLSRAALPAKHCWRRTISATASLIRDMHICHAFLNSKLHHRIATSAKPAYATQG